MSSLLQLSALALLILGLQVAQVRRVDACAVAWNASAGAPPRIDAEEALIVWDSANHIEHFIREANFGGARTPFAFMVPTPTRPTVGEAAPNVFDRLAEIYRRPVPVPRSGNSRLGTTMGIDPPRQAVTVLEQRRVAGLDMTILSASDPRSLATWLRAHGFSERPELDTWLGPYVESGYFLTTFRYVPGDEPVVRASAVRLTFSTTVPFYPYAEPAGSSPSNARRLIVSVVSTERVSGMLGTTPWSTQAGYAGQPAGLVNAIRDSLPSGATHGPWLTTFDERRSVRGSADLTFVRAADQRAMASSITP